MVVEYNYAILEFNLPDPIPAEAENDPYYDASVTVTLKGRNDKAYLSKTYSLNQFKHKESF